MRHTQENLDRLNDIREEMGKQLERLHHQAKTAERYQHLTNEKKQIEQECLALRWQKAHESLKAHQIEIQEREEKLIILNEKTNSLFINLHEIEQRILNNQAELQLAEHTFYENGITLARIQENEKQRQYRLNEVIHKKEQANKNLEDNKQKQVNNESEVTQLIEAISTARMQLDIEKEQLEALLENYQEIGNGAFGMAKTV